MRGQVNLIVVAGMLAMTIIALLNEYNFINQEAMASHIYLSAQNTMLQALLLRNYLIQQGLYKVELAEFITALNGSYMQTFNCGYINTSKLFPFIPVPRIYYWQNAQGQVCIPSNNAIENTLIYLLSNPYFAQINTTLFDQNIQYYLDFNLTQNGNYFVGNIVIPPFNSTLTLQYSRSSDEFWLYNGSTLLAQGTLFSPVIINGFNYTIGPEISAVSGALTMPATINNFFSQIPGNIPLSLISTYSLVTLAGGQQAIILSTNNSGLIQIYAFPIYFTNAETLAKASNGQYSLIVSVPSGSWNTQGENGSFTLNGITYDAFFYGNVTDIGFEIYPASFATLSIQPHFLIYKYLLNYGSAHQTSFLTPSTLGYIQIQASPFANAQVCITEEGVGYSVRNCVPLAWSYSTANYLSMALASATNFVNDTFPVGFGQFVKGYPQFVLYNFLMYAANLVNMRTVYYYGKPLYDWYANILAHLGYINQIGITSSGTYTASQGAAQQAVISALLNLFDYQTAATASFLSGIPYTIALYNLSIKAADQCNSAYSLNFTYTNYTASSFISSGTQYLPLPISFIFLYSNRLFLKPTIGCTSQNPYNTAFYQCYPGFDYSLRLQNKTLTCCSPIIAPMYLNRQCVATLITNDSSVATYIESLGYNCQSVLYHGVTAYICPQVNYEFKSVNRYTNANSCPLSFITNINGNQYNFSISFNTQRTFYGILYQFGGGAQSSLKTSIYNWSFGIVNKTSKNSLQLGPNFIVDALINISGIYPDAFILLSSGNNIDSNMYAVNLNAYAGLNQYMSISNYKQSIITQSAFNAVPNSLMEVLISNTCNGGCRASVYANGVYQFNAPGLSSLGLLGISTYYYPTIVNLKYLIAYNNYSSVLQGVTDFLSSYQLSKVFPIYSRLLSLAKVPISNTTFVNLVFLNQQSFPQEYLLKLPITSAFMQFSPSSTQIVGIWNNSGKISVSPLYWYNLTSIAPGSYIWINLTNKTPEYLVIFYGNGVSDCSWGSSSICYHNATKTFPIIVAPGIKGFQYSVNNLTNRQGKYVFSNNQILLEKTGGVPPYIYNSTLNDYAYSTFACIHYSGPIEIMNISYFAGSQYYTSQTRYYGYNPIYPNASLISSIDVVSLNNVTRANITPIQQPVYWTVRGKGIYPEILYENG
jgi:hypothetical protein